MANNLQNHLDDLKSAYHNNDLVLYLGAGISIPNGLPSWDKLVLSMYFSSNREIFSSGHIRPFPNYLFAISEWMMKEKNEPLDILIRKLKRYVKEDDFMKLLVETLYAGFKIDQDPYNYNENEVTMFECHPYQILDANETLKSIANLCHEREKGVKTIITYNYDNLLELGLQEVLGDDNYFKPIYRKNDELDDGQQPVYHVHGYIPIPNNIDELKGSSYEEIILSEESYHRAAQNAYYWGNMVQMQHLSNSIGLMIGMSLSDRNIRRILDSLKSTPIKTKNYLLTRRPKEKQMNDCDTEFIRDRAKVYMGKFERSGRTSSLQLKTDFTIEKIANIINEHEINNFEEDFRDLGLELVWFDDFEEIPGILQSITN